MIGSMSGCEQFAITSKQYFENYNEEINDWIARQYLNNYKFNKKDPNKEVQETEEKVL